MTNERTIRYALKARLSVLPKLSSVSQLLRTGKRSAGVNRVYDSFITIVGAALRRTAHHSITLHCTALHYYVGG